MQPLRRLFTYFGERRIGLKEVKTKESGNAPKILTDTARAPKELAKRSMLQAKERARIASQRPETQQDDSPDRYKKADNT